MNEPAPTVERPASRPRRSARAWLRLAARGVLIWAAVVLPALVAWLRSTFGDVSLGQIVFHWRFLGGSASIAPIIATDFIVTCLGAPLLVAVLVLWLERRIVRPRLRRAGGEARRRRLGRLLAVLPGLVIVGGTLTLAVRTSAMQFLSPIGVDDYFGAHYVPPGGVELVAGARRNLVLIYVESLEASYEHPGVFGRDLLASLDALHPVSFDRFRQMPGTGWTIAAMVSTQCALPLEPVGVLDPHTQGERTEAFLPRAVCLGDLLAAQGYRNVFLGGASLEFSGKGQFLRDHHYDDAWGREEWERLGVPRKRMSGWGLHDDDLFAQAKAKLRELHAAGRPFNLTMLTVDTHWPSGFLSEGCRDRGADALEGIVECTADQVADLIAFLRAEGWDADTNVVVVGDHLTPPNTLAPKLALVPRREIYNGFFARAAPGLNRKEIVHFDLLPTVLDFIGLHPRGGRLGLGLSGFGTPEAPVPTEQTLAEMAEKVLAPSRTYVRLWEPWPAASTGPDARRAGR